MTDQSVFNDQAPATPPLEQQNQAPANAYLDLLNGIKNEQGLPKYATVDEALKALAHSQAYIPEVKNQLSQKDQELAQLREELKQRQSIEDVVSRLATQNQPAPVADQPAGRLDESAVMKLVQQHLEQREATTVAQANELQVSDALRAKFGEKAAEMVVQRSAELGLTKQALGELSRKSPQAVLALFNASGAPAPKPTTSSVHIPAGTPADQLTLERPTKSLLSGAKTQDQVAYMQKIRDKVYRDNGINQ